jgi:multiple sugar transport system substrate-binding protein
MMFYTLCANLGEPCRTEGPGDLVEIATGTHVLEMIREIAALVDAACLGMDPIAVCEVMAKADSRFVCAPLIYGYVSYAMKGFRPARLAFADIPAAGSAGPVGSALGGTGIAVSNFSEAKDAAIDFAYWVAGARTQRGIYAGAASMPARADNLATQPPGKTQRSTQPPAISTRIRARPWKAPGCGHATTATWHSSNLHPIASTRR